MATKKVGLKADGRLKKGFRYNENGRIVKAKKSVKAKQSTTKKARKR